MSQSQPRAYTRSQWEEQKPTIEKLYVHDDKKLAEVMRTLEDEHGFPVSKKQLKSRITKWGFDVKNIRGDVMMEMSRVQTTRLYAERKASAFRVNKRPVDKKKIVRYMARQGITEEELLNRESLPRSSSPAFSVYTPCSSPGPPDPEYMMTNGQPASCNPFVDRLREGLPYTILSSKRLWQASSLPQHIDFSNGSPELLIRSFLAEVPNILPLAEAPTPIVARQWKTMIIPLWPRYPALFYAVCATGANLSLSKNHDLERTALQHHRKSLHALGVSLSRNVSHHGRRTFLTELMAASLVLCLHNLSRARSDGDFTDVLSHLRCFVEILRLLEPDLMRTGILDFLSQIWVSLHELISSEFDIVSPNDYSSSSG